jgi:N-acyl homoserine lactone hydrolase
MEKYWIRPIALCKGKREGSIHTYMTNFGKPSGMAVYSWYIEGSQPKTLVDVGCQADLLISHVGAPTDHIQSIEDGFKKVGIKMADIEQVIVTHLHGDHVALAPKFPKAKFIVQKAEMEAFLHPHPYTALTGFYNKEWLQGAKIETIERDVEIRSGIRVMLTPGHTPGAQSVVIETPKGIAVITGFCCTFDNFNPPEKSRAKGLEVIPSGRHVNPLQAYDSILKVKKTGYYIIPNHDDGFVGTDRLPG